MDLLNGLSVCTGIGGFDIALSEYVRPVAYCEINKYAQAVLLSRMAEGKIPIAPIWDDIRTLTKEQIDIPINIIYAGFPCQNISVAGSGEGLDGEQSSLVFEIFRLARELKPAFVFLENSPAVRTRGLDRILQEFTNAGYDCRWTVLSAAEVGAWQIRKRWFLLAHLNSIKLWEQQGRCERENRKGSSESRNYCEKEFMANIGCTGLEGQRKISIHQKEADSIPCYTDWWETEPDVGRVVHGLSKRLDRIKCLGNSVVPLQAKIAFERLIGL